MNLISRKKVQGGVYKDIKDKKAKGPSMEVDGHKFKIHSQKQFLL